MRKFFIILSLLVGLPAFAIEGKIEAFMPIKLKVTKGDSEFGPGEFTAILETTRKNELKLEVRKAGKNNNPVAYFKVPKSKKIPKGNGTLTLTPQESGQPYALEAIWTTQTTDGPEQWRSETCQYRVPETICYPDHRGRRTRCEIRDRWVMGWRDVRFFDRVYDQQVEFGLFDPQQIELNAASFAAATSFVERVYVYQGICR